MGSIKCPHCGLVQFSAQETCKRCKKKTGVQTGVVGGYTSPRSGKSVSAAQSANPFVSWIITLLLLTANTSLALAVSRRSATDPAEVVGATVGGLIAWPLILLIIY